MVAKSVVKSVAKLVRGAAAPMVGLVLALSAVGCTKLPSPPSDPAYDTEVLPIFQAHCTRCHGAGPDGGSLNVPTAPHGLTDAEVTDFLNERIFLTQFQTSGDCSAVGNVLASDCRYGAEVAARVIPGVINSARSAASHMPPPPAPDLNDWELGVLRTWSANPVCSNSPNPDPTICPPGS